MCSVQCTTYLHTPYYSECTVHHIPSYALVPRSIHSGSGVIGQGPGPKVGAGVGGGVGGRGHSFVPRLRMREEVSPTGECCRVHGEYSEYRV
jgi:hypothetical protein